MSRWPLLSGSQYGLLEPLGGTGVSGQFAAACLVSQCIQWQEEAPLDLGVLLGKRRQQQRLDGPRVVLHSCAALLPYAVAMRSPKQSGHYAKRRKHYGLP